MDWLLDPKFLRKWLAKEELNELRKEWLKREKLISELQKENEELKAKLENI